MAVLAERLRSGTCHIGIYGLGYVGLPLALRFAEMGIRVTGFDIDPHKVDTLNSGNSYIERITAADIIKARETNFTATTDFTLTAELDAQIICAPTPLDQHHQPDLTTMGCALAISGSQPVAWGHFANVAATVSASL